VAEEADENDDEDGDGDDEVVVKSLETEVKVNSRNGVHEFFILEETPLVVLLLPP